MKKKTSFLSAIMQTQQVGLVLGILAIGAVLTMRAGTHVDPLTGHEVNNFLDPEPLVLRGRGPSSAGAPWIGLMLRVGIGLVCRLVNGFLVTGFRVHPFIITDR